LEQLHFPHLLFLGSHHFDRCANIVLVTSQVCIRTARMCQHYFSDISVVSS